MNNAENKGRREGETKRFEAGGGEWAFAVGLLRNSPENVLARAMTD